MILHYHPAKVDRSQRIKSHFTLQYILYLNNRKYFHRLVSTPIRYLHIYSGDKTMCRSAFTDLNNNGCLSVTCLSKTNNLHMTSENGLQPVERPSRGLLRDCDN